MSAKPSPSLYVISPDGRLKEDPDPVTDIMIISNELELCYALTEAVAFQTWSRGAQPGGQPDPPFGTKAWFKTGNLERDPKLDKGFWLGKDTLFMKYRNEASSGDTELWDKTEQYLKYAMFISLGLVVLAGIFAFGKGFVV